jgi:hypothetical protein
MLTKYKKAITEKSLIMCTDCYKFFDGVCWGAAAPSYPKKDQNKKIVMKLVQCPTCKNLELAVCEVEFNLVPR